MQTPEAAKRWRLAVLSSLAPFRREGLGAPGSDGHAAPVVALSETLVAVSYGKIEEVESSRAS